jgi:hypothetical protein
MCIFEYSGRCQTIFKSVLSIDSMVMMMMIIPLILINIWYVQSVSQLFITAANSWDKQLINRKFYFGSQFWWFQSMTIAGACSKEARHGGSGSKIPHLMTWESKREKLGPTIPFMHELPFTWRPLTGPHLLKFPLPPLWH